LIGYSLGARVIYSCLSSLAERRAFGLVESVVFIGAPAPSNSNTWRAMRSVVSGKMINVYSENDYILAFLYRATSIQLGVAGLQRIGDVEGVQNLNLSAEVSGHLRYPELIGKILKKTGFADVRVDNIDIKADDGVIQLLDTEGENEEKEDADVKDMRKEHFEHEVLWDADAVNREHAEHQVHDESKDTSREHIESEIDPDREEAARDYIEGDMGMLQLIDAEAESEDGRRTPTSETEIEEAGDKDRPEKAVYVEDNNMKFRDMTHR